MAQGISKCGEAFPFGWHSWSRETMGEERSSEEPVGSSRTNALAKNSANDQNRETNQEYVNRMFSDNRQGSNSRKQQRQRQQ
ncbi:MAG: hypothetical protein HOA75_06670 [Deltaproteobacteria bacterium]|nr:hypothetical protein [Deltaproteobacteria bacterium]